MFCTNCGRQLANGSTYCPFCGTTQAPRPEQPPELKQETPPASDPGTLYPRQPEPYVQQPARPVPADPMNDPRGMKWFKFILYFQLFANALINLINAVTVFTGAHYQGAADTVYAVFPAEHTVDIVYGLLCLALAAFGIYTRFRLSSFKRNGPGLYLGLIAANILVPVLYMLLSSAVTGIPLTSLLDVNGIVSLAANVIMLVVNKIYFDKRKDLFEN